MSFPLSGVRVLELAGLAPGPFAGSELCLSVRSDVERELTKKRAVVLADFGADVVRVDRNGTSFNMDTLARGKRSISVSLKSPSGLSVLCTLLSAPPTGCSNPSCKCSPTKVCKCSSNKNKDLWRADVLIDPFRPGVLERLGLDPKELIEKNPGLIVARLTGFRREGPYSKMAGHDINYAALSGVLSMLGRKGDKPYFPANILADFAGGGMMAVLGIVMALVERSRSGKGQIIAIDMITGSRYVSSFPLSVSRPSLGLPIWDQPRGENFLDGGAPWYDVYETKDGGYMSVGALENPFYTIFLTTLLKKTSSNLIPTPPPEPKGQMDRSLWPSLASFLTLAFKQKTRSEWTSIFLNTDACCVPVLNPNEVDSDGLGFDEPGAVSSELGGEGGDGGVPNPTPLLSRTPARKHAGVGEMDFFLVPGKDSKSVLKEAGLGNEVKKLIEDGAVEVAEDEEGDQVKAKL